VPTHSCIEKERLWTPIRRPLRESSGLYHCRVLGFDHALRLATTQGTMPLMSCAYVVACLCISRVISLRLPAVISASCAVTDCLPACFHHRPSPQSTSSFLLSPRTRIICNDKVHSTIHSNGLTQSHRHCAVSAHLQQSRLHKYYTDGKRRHTSSAMSRG
jgi:hypothetical protein